MVVVADVLGDNQSLGKHVISLSHEEDIDHPAFVVALAGNLIRVGLRGGFVVFSVRKHLFRQHPLPPLVITTIR